MTHTILEEQIKEFDERFCIARLTQKVAVAKLSRDQSENIKSFLRSFYLSIIEGVFGEIKKQRLYNKDYGKHVHIFVFENKGRCGICKMSWKDTEQESIYNTALSDLQARLAKIKTI